MVLPRRPAKCAVPEDLRAPVQEAIETLIAYSTCRKANYEVSRNAIVVYRDPDGAKGTFTVKGMHRERNKALVTGGEVGDVARTFKLATLQAIAFLDGPHAAEPSDDESQGDQRASGASGGAPPGPAAPKNGSD